MGKVYDTAYKIEACLYFMIYYFLRQSQAKRVLSKILLFVPDGSNMDFFC